MGNRFRLLGLVLLCLIAVPAVGYLSSFALLQKYNSDFDTAAAARWSVSIDQIHSAGVSLSTICAKENDEVCSDLSTFDLLRSASEYAAIGGVLLVLLVLAAAYLSRNNRARLALAFGVVPRLAMLALSVSILTQGTILVYLSYELPAVFSGHYFPKLTLIVGLGALVVAWQLLRYAFAFFQKYPMRIVGSKVTKAEAPGLFQLIGDVSEKTSAKPPSNVVVGLEPNFFVTAADVQLVDEAQPLTGTTLYVSLPFLNILNHAELSAVLGHEMGHFVGADTVYSMKFAPSYLRMHNAIGAIEAQTRTQNAAGLWALPALMVLGFLYAEFSTSERTISRTRELEADKIGASLSSSHSLVSALLKVSEYNEIWNDLRIHNIDRLNEGHIYGDLAGLFSAVSKERYQGLEFEAARSRLVGAKLAHPTDTHPTIAERMTALGVVVDTIHKEDLAPADNSLNLYFAEPNLLSEALSIKEHRLMVALGRATLPAAPPSQPADEIGAA